MASQTASDDAATDALIARFIAEDFGRSVGSQYIGGSIEDYEDPMSSYERGLAEGTIDENENDTSWGSPDITSSEIAASPAIVYESTGERWDSGTAYGETLYTTPNEHEGAEHQHGENTTHHISDQIYTDDTEPHGVAQMASLPAHVPCSPLTDPRWNIFDPEANSASIMERPTCQVSPAWPLYGPCEYAGYIDHLHAQDPPTRVPTPPDPRQDVSDTPRLEATAQPHLVRESQDPQIPPNIPEPRSPASQIQTTDPRRNISDLPRLETTTTQHDLAGRSASLPLQDSISFPFGSGGHNLQLPASASHTRESEALIWPKPILQDFTGKPVSWTVPAPTTNIRLSAADRYAGLDIDYSSSKGKGRALAQAFDELGRGDDFAFALEDGYGYHLKGMKKAENWEVDEGESAIPCIHIRLCDLGMGLSRREQEEWQRMEDNAVVEIRVDQHETIESILQDIISKNYRVPAVKGKEKAEAEKVDNPHYSNTRSSTFGPPLSNLQEGADSRRASNTQPPVLLQGVVSGQSSDLATGPRPGLHG